MPRLHAVKTRLAAVLGPDRALDTHRLLLTRTLSIVARVEAETRLLQIAGTDDAGECAHLAAHFGLQLAPQSEGGLGERMAAALDEALLSHARAVLIGSDCPVLEPSDLEAAFASLDAADLVLSPAEDGGYALIGASRPGLPVFDGVAWGTDQVLPQTLARAAAAGLRIRQLRTLWDVDTLKDWERWRAHVHSGARA